MTPMLRRMLSAAILVAAILTAYGLRQPPDTGRPAPAPGPAHAHVVP
jgi:hypothetical protein